MMEPRMDDDDDVGYCRPPKKSRFRAGQSGNPLGRPPKAKPNAGQSGTDTCDADVIAAIGEQIVEINGRRMTRKELLYEAAFARAIKGDTAAMRILVGIMEKNEKAKSSKELRKGGGVLVVPGTAPLHEWNAAAALQQAGYREASHGKGEL
jgi:hypothetical protein